MAAIRWGAKSTPSYVCWSSMAKGHRATARSVLDKAEHSGILGEKGGDKTVIKIMVATLAAPKTNWCRMSGEIEPYSEGSVAQSLRG